MKELWHQVTKTIREHTLFTKGQSVVLAVSGGIDSMVLLHYMVKNQHTLGVTIHVAHVNHQLRGNEAIEDYRLVESTCAKYGVPFYGTEIPIGELKKVEKGSTQMVARKYRYNYLYAVMKETSSTVLVTAHHADDQLETVLQKLTRGVSDFSEAGIPIRRAFKEFTIVRPLLEVWKSTVAAYALEELVEYREDASNQSDAYQRNRIRHHIIPKLKEENPQLHLHIQRLLLHAAEDDAFLREETEKHMEKVVKIKDKEIVLDNSAFYTLALPLQRRMIHLILNYLYIDQPYVMHSKHVTSVLQLIHHVQPNVEIHLPDDWFAKKEGEKTTFTQDPVSIPSLKQELKKLPLETVVQWGDKRSFLLSKKAPTEIAIPFQTFTEINLVEESMLFLRTRKPGDKINVKGLTGRKKVKSIMIDHKVPKHERGEWPLVVNEEDEILWVPGLQHGEQKLIVASPASVAYVYELKD